MQIISIVFSNFNFIHQSKRSIYGNYNWTQTEFQETVEMSTYLVAVIVSDFKCITSMAYMKLSRPVSVSVCARPSAIDQLDYALNVSVQILEFFESYYNVKYPLPKLDHVAVPDFNAAGNLYLN
jgi:aminopeptidase N